MSERISPDIFILTSYDLRRREERAFQRGVERGKFEAISSGLTTPNRIAKNCANWRAGYCDVCGAQSQYNEVSEDFACPKFRPAPAQSQKGGSDE